MTYFFKNKNVCIIIQFWFSFCGPSLMEKFRTIPISWATLYCGCRCYILENFAGQGFPFLTVTLKCVFVPPYQNSPSSFFFSWIRFFSAASTSFHSFALRQHAQTKREFNTTRGSQQLFHRGNTSRQRLHLSLQGPRYSTKPHGFLSLNKNISSEEFFTWTKEEKWH